MWFKKDETTLIEIKLEHVFSELEEQRIVTKAQAAQIKALQDELSSISLWAGMNDYEYTEPK